MTTVENFLAFGLSVLPAFVYIIGAALWLHGRLPGGSCNKADVGKKLSTQQLLFLFCLF